MHPVVTSPINGFDKLPLAHEISNGANIARLKYYKNFIISHSKYGTISNVDFSRIWIDLEQAITTLDNSAATAASLKVAKTHTLDSGMAKLLSTQNILDTKVSYLQEQFVIYTDNKRKENEELKQLIEDQKAEMKKTSVNFDFEVKERKGKEDSVSKRLNLGETALFENKERVRALGKDLEEFQYFQQLLSSEFNKMETIVKESKEEKETSEKQIQSLCCQVNACICKHKERMNAFETKSEMFDEILLNVQKNVDILKLESESVRIQTTRVSKRVEDLDVMIQTLDEDHIPKHIRAQHNNEIKYWETDDTYFLETRATHHILSSLPFNTCIVVTGSSGCGKSANIHHAALYLRDRFKYEIIPIMKPSEIMSYHNDKKNQVFVIDDICGKDTINKQTIQKWRDYSDKIETIFEIAEQDKEIKNGNTVSRLLGPKLLISCRLHIYKDSQFQSVTLLNKRTFNLLSTELCLLQQERMVMLHKYIKDDINDNIVEVMDKVDYFPLLCKLSKNKSSEEVRKLLTDPVDRIKKTINIIIAENEKQFCVLVLCILFDDGFNTNWLEVESVPAEKKYKLEEIVKEFGIDLSKQLSRKILKSSFDTLTDTYLKRIGTEYRMIHDKIYVMAATICGQLLTQSFIRYAPYVFIRDYFIFESLKEVQKNDQWIVLTKDEEGDYFERLLSDLRKFVITSTFHNKQLKYKSFIDKLIRYFGSSIETKALLKKLDIEGCKVEYDDGEYIDYIFTTPLIESVSYGFFDIAQFLIDEYREPPLNIACEGGHTHIVRALLQNHADVSLCNLDGKSPLYLACTCGHTEVVKLLLQKNADAHHYNETPLLYVASQKGYTEQACLMTFIKEWTKYSLSFSYSMESANEENPDNISNVNDYEEIDNVSYHSVVWKNYNFESDDRPSINRELTTPGELTSPKLSSQKYTIPVLRPSTNSERTRLECIFKGWIFKLTNSAWILSI
ncbi:unnamed protein product [Mytilus edulis]|uniref:DZIP3-like HEPN domain-containing protein n=1 Tax=Mytilus edulis TaxID=6550 RepID=A0A8S3VDA6_MYTED|nr:unnamed protein product [Mytilus edulis]